MSLFCISVPSWPTFVPSRRSMLPCSTPLFFKIQPSSFFVFFRTMLLFSVCQIDFCHVPLSRTDSASYFTITRLAIILCRARMLTYGCVLGTGRQLPGPPFPHPCKAEFLVRMYFASVILRKFFPFFLSLWTLPLFSFLSFSREGDPCAGKPAAIGLHAYM